MGIPLGRAPISTMDLAEYILTTQGDATRRVKKGELKDYLDSLDYCLDTGTANTYVLTPTIPITAYEAGQAYKFKALNANTGASTINISGVGAKALVKSGNTALAAGDIPKDAIVTTIYDGVNFQIVPDYSAQLSDKVSKSNIANNAVTTTEGLVLDARQGKIFQDEINVINNKITWKQATGFTTLTASKTQYATVTQTVNAIIGSRKVCVRFGGDYFVFDNINNSQVTKSYIQAYGSTVYDVTISISVNFGTGVITIATIYYGTSQGTLTADAVFYE